MRKDEKTLRLQAPAKINLYLEVLGRRPDGYHGIRTVMQAVSLFDELSFASRDDGRIVLACTGEGLPPPEENLVVRAARLLRERCRRGLGADIVLKKAIPIGGGLGGGSSDCAATLQALNELWGLGLSFAALQELAAELGSDVAFFLHGGAALCEGRGEQVTPLPTAGSFHYVLVMPPVPVSTAQVYAALADSLTKIPRGCSMDLVRSALAAGNARLLGGALYNALQTSAFQLSADLYRIWLETNPVCSRLGCLGLGLSGSGSTMFGLFEGPEQARRAAMELAEALEVPAKAVRNLEATPGGMENYCERRLRG